LKSNKYAWSSDGNTINFDSVILDMSVIFCLEDSPVLQFEPVEFRRVHLLQDEKLKYSHSELVITLNERRVMVDVILLLLDRAKYRVKINGMEFNSELNSPESLQHVKHLVFINFPDLAVSDVYCNKDLKPASE